MFSRQNVDRVDDIGPVLAAAIDASGVMRLPALTQAQAGQVQLVFCGGAAMSQPLLHARVKTPNLAMRQDAECRSLQIQ